MDQQVCLIVGVGPGNGAAFARRFHIAGYRVGLVARSAGTLDELAAELPGTATAAADVREPASLTAALDKLRERLGPPDVVVYNAGAGAFENLDAATPASLESAWRTNVLGLFVTARAEVTRWRERGRGALVVIGATAALRGGANFLPFAAAKAAQRSVAQSLARQLGPEGIHVAYVVLDGVVDLPRTRAAMPDKPPSFFLQPTAIADAVYHVVQQGPQAWTFELDLRPFAERW